MSRLCIASILFIAMMPAVLPLYQASAFTSGEFDEYAFQSCITYCYANFRPSRRPADHEDCVNRCHRLYGKDRYNPSPPRKRDYGIDSPASRGGHTE